VVVGGGIAGLAAAHELGRRLPEARVVLLEATERVGGKLRVGELAGQPVDVGAESLLARRPEGIELAHAAGLGPALMTPSTTSARVWAGGAPHALPARTMMGVPSELEATRTAGVLTEEALAIVAGEPGEPPIAPLTQDLSVGALVRERLGNQVLDRLVEPLLGGVYAGRADDLSLRATMPALYARLELRGGSLIDAARVVTANGARATPHDPVFVSVRGGLGQLAPAVVDRGRFTVRTGVTVRAVTRTDRGFRLECGPVAAREWIEADAVVVAVPAAKAGQLLVGLAPAASADLLGIESASMAIVSLAFRDVRPPLGSGLLIGSREGFAVKAVTISSQKWPGTPAGLTLLRASVGRVGETRDLQREDADLVALVRGDLATLTGIDAMPVDAVVTRWGAGLPQYAVGHVDRVVRIRAAVARVPGLAVCGAAYDGVGIPACIASARRAADQVVAALDDQGQWRHGRR
jgi:oxygen-dependent protoporphyrinogen oxidase